jgi:two-component system, NarL family, sensor kinase
MKFSFIFLKKIKILFTIILSLLIWNTVYAQDVNFTMESHQKKLDATINELDKYKRQDTARLSALIRVLDATRFKKDKELVMIHYQEANALSKKLNNKLALARCLFFIGSYYKSCSNYATAISRFDSVNLIVGNSADTTLQKIKASANMQLGHIYKEQENYYSALKSYFESLKYYEKTNHLYKMINYKMIGVAYESLHNTEKAIIYNKLFLNETEKNNDKNSTLDALLSLSSIYLNKNKIDSSIFYLDKCEIYVNDSVNKTLLFDYYNKLGYINFLQKNYGAATLQFEKALTLTDIQIHTSQRGAVLQYYAIAELRKGNFIFAKKMADEFLAISLKNNNKNQIANSYTVLADYYSTTGNFNKAYRFLQKSVIINDSMLSETNLRQANTLSNIYENEKKEKEISQLQLGTKQKEATLKEKSTTNKILIGSVMALSLFSFLGYRNLRAKRKLQQAKITELEKDKQLLAIDAMLQGQEAERNRIAKDLHDGLGGMLSGVKLNFVNMKENLVMDATNVATFEKSILQLDNTIAELRKVAHNLMPEALVKFGLKNALLDYSYQMQLSSKIKIVYEQMGLDRDLNNTADLYIYRILQELINNAIKHATAKQILVQLTKNEHNILITVEDDGKGFDKNNLDQDSGIGMKSVQQRVDYLKGNMEINSTANEGTSIHIELQA